MNSLKCDIRYNEPLNLHTSLKVGGNADLYAIPKSVEYLISLVKYLKEENIPYFTIGKGFNLLVSDSGFRGCVISLENLAGILTRENGEVDVFSGCSNINFIKELQKNSLGGISFLYSIPGSIGGALAMNAGADGFSTLEFVKAVTLLKNGALEVVAKENLNFGYRYLKLEEGDIILGARFALKEVSSDITEAELVKSREARKNKQSVGYPNAGSFFKNPDRHFAWKLIDEAGLRGFQIGGAQISSVHTNFFVNRGGATATDFILLMREAIKRVEEKFGITLEPEVKIVGEKLL